jgi:hypothetical protein
MTDRKRLADRLRSWWTGEWEAMNGAFYINRSPWATRLDRVLQWCHRNSWNLVFLAIGIVSIALALLTLN